MLCPECEQPMEMIERDPSVGIMTGGWYCDACEISEDLDDPEGMPE